MITESSREGLIISASARPTAALDELIVACEWPVLLEATPLRLQRELALGAPELGLFWMDDKRHVEDTVRLLDWLRGYQPDTRRVVVGYRLAADAEVKARAAGAHLYLPATDPIVSLVDGLLAAWTRDRTTAASRAERRPATRAAPGSQRRPGVPLHPGGPP